jgi:murein L,D-transpeptidase YafK
MEIKQFKYYKERIFSKKEDKKIEFKNINIVPYPNSLNKQMFKVLMDEDYKTKYYTFNGRKELYIELKDNKIKILAEG